MYYWFIFKTQGFQDEENQSFHAWFMNTPQTLKILYTRPVKKLLPYADISVEQWTSMCDSRISKTIYLIALGWNWNVCFSLSMAFVQIIHPRNICQTPVRDMSLPVSVPHNCPLSHQCVHRRHCCLSHDTRTHVLTKTTFSPVSNHTK